MKSLMFLTIVLSFSSLVFAQTQQQRSVFDVPVCTYKTSDLNLPFAAALNAVESRNLSPYSPTGHPITGLTSFDFTDSQSNYSRFLLVDGDVYTVVTAFASLKPRSIADFSKEISDKILVSDWQHFKLENSDEYSLNCEDFSLDLSISNGVEASLTFVKSDTNRFAQSRINRAIRAKTNYQKGEKEAIEHQLHLKRTSRRSPQEGGDPE